MSWSQGEGAALQRGLGFQRAVSALELFGCLKVASLNEFLNNQKLLQNFVLRKNCGGARAQLEGWHGRGFFSVPARSLSRWLKVTRQITRGVGMVQGQFGTLTGL